jgi:hypothetical protein
VSLVAQWGVRGLRRTCRSIRTHLESQGTASPEELAVIWPGGRDNARTGHGAWIYAYGQLLRFMAREERAVTAQEGAAAEQLAQAALAAKPVPLKVVGEGVPAHLAVHPKSFAALEHMAQIDRRMRHLLSLQMVLQSHGDAEEAITAAGKAVMELYLMLAWASTHPGPGVPWAWHASPWDGGGPDVPDWVRGLAPEIITAIATLHLTVNVGRLRALEVLTNPRPDKGGTGWSTFFASMATELGEDVTALMRERPMTALIAQSALVAEQHRRASEKSEEAA